MFSFTFLRNSLIFNIIINNKMKLKNFNYTKPIKVNNLIITKENVIILFSLVLFIAISTVIISLIIDTIINSFNLLGEINFLSNEYENHLINNKTTSCLVIKQEVIKYRVSIFNPFIDLFHKSHSSYKYFPSYFQTFALIDYRNNIMTSKNIPCSDFLIIKEIISYNKYLILESQNNDLNVLFNDLCRLLLEYKQINCI